MVTRVDRKPIIYNTTLIRSWRPVVHKGNKILLKELLSKSVGHSVPRAPPSVILDDYEDIDTAFRMFGVDDPLDEIYGIESDRDSDEYIRMARTMIDRHRSRITVMRNENLMDEAVKVQADMLKGAERIYYGTEAAYVLMHKVLNDQIFEPDNKVRYQDWAKSTAEKVITIQSPYMFIHPSATHDMCKDMSHRFGYRVWGMWHKFKKVETMLIRISSRKNIAAHSYFSGGKARNFDPSKNRLDDFELPITGYAQVKENVKVYSLMGIKYVSAGGDLLVLSSDDCQNASVMAQAHFRTAMYFMESNKYAPGTVEKAIGILKDMTGHCVRLIDLGKNFSNFIRGLHILVQKDFNDVWEERCGSNLGWRERSNNYVKESKELDANCVGFHKRIMALAQSDVDRLNVGFFYHAFIGDEMLIDDLRRKVRDMPGKVMNADEGTWNSFINFSKSYLLCRYMKVYKRKPKVGGDVSQLNAGWAAACCSNKLVMPPKEDWGKAWISGEFTWTAFADMWHLEAQDVAYVPKDSKGLKEGKYKTSKFHSSELLMAMTTGQILDELTGSTPTSARERICSKMPVTEVVLTTAPKAENAKPSWKKRVTFAADCEFRKMQAEYDRNCRKVMSFVRGPSLGVDQYVLESQFRGICQATTIGEGGAICSHDISAWSESMDRSRKFEFESILTTMLSEPNMNNIKYDWAKIQATVLKQGTKDVIALDNGSFQGFDGSASTILHSLILIYCMETARRDIGMSRDVRTDMATLIDDCVALMKGLDKDEDALVFWNHLKATYLKLGFEVDELKSIFSTIKAIYLSRRFLRGAEVPADMKVYIKAHCSYEDPLRCATDIFPDIFGATRGACDANGDVWFIYYTTLVSSLAELAHQVPKVIKLDPGAAAVIALAPASENGWAVPSLIDWTTNDVMDKRTHFNAIMESACQHDCASQEFKRGIEVVPKAALRMVHALKSQAWRIVSYSNLFTSPFEAVREGPLKPDMLRRNAVSDLMQEVITAEPWVSLMKWNTSATTQRIRQLLIDSGPLHAPTLSALVNCMPDNYRLGMVGKAIGSNSLLNILPRGMKVVLKRRVSRCAMNFFEYGASLFSSTHEMLESDDYCVVNHVTRTTMEREEFYALNGIDMFDHTFPDPVASFTHADNQTRSSIGPNLTGLRVWDAEMEGPIRMNEYISNNNLYVPPRSGRVWEVTSEYARGWDSVSQRVAMGLAILARANADGHRIEGLLSYFAKSWNEMANITPEDTQLISIHGSMKRLDSNPGSSSHPITAHRNILSGLEVQLASCLDALDFKAKELCGVPSHLHDVLSHKSAMRAVTSCILSLFMNLGVADHVTRYQIALRPDCVIPISTKLMSTHKAAARIDVEIIDGYDNYGLLQASPTLAHVIVIPTMRAGWVDMINALVSGDHIKCNELLAEAKRENIDDLIAKMASSNVYYSTNVVTAQEPAPRQRIDAEKYARYAIIPQKESGRVTGDSYTMSVKGIGSRFSRALSKDQPEYIVAAVAIKSYVWDRVKKLDHTELAKIYYDDPDANYEILKVCTGAKFWKGVVSEVMMVKRKRALSELLVSGFRSLSICEIRLVEGDDPNTVTHGIASFFGAHLKSVTKIIEHELLSITGRSAQNYETPSVERMITNNPALMNNKLRKDHMHNLINHNLKLYDTRIDQLEKFNSNSADAAAEVQSISHRGDRRIAMTDKHLRLADLRNRRSVYKNTSVGDHGKVVISEAGIFNYLTSAAKSVSDKHGYGIEVPTSDDIPGDQVITLDDCMDFSVWFHEEANRAKDGKAEVIEDEVRRDKKRNEAHGWYSTEGNVGLKYAYDTIMNDSESTSNTKFAVSASEIAPKVARRVRETEKGEPKLDAQSQVIPQPMGDAAESSHLIPIEEYLLMMSGKKLKPKKANPVPAWQALFTNIHTGTYMAVSVNAKLGTSLPFHPTLASIREAALDQLTDEQVMAAFPSVFADYLDCRATFTDEWMTDNESDAYTIDEASSTKRGALF